MERSNENVIEWLTGTDRVAVTFSQQKYISKIKKLAEKNSDIEVTENKDGSVFANFPLSWIKISPPKKMSEEQKEAAAERFRKMWEEKKNEESD